MTELCCKFWIVSGECTNCLSIVALEGDVVSRAEVDRVKKSCPPDCLLTSGRNGKKLGLGGACGDRLLLRCLPVDDATEQHKGVSLRADSRVAIIGKRSITAG